MYRAQDENGRIFDYENKPFEENDCWNISGGFYRQQEKGKRNPNWRAACFNLDEVTPDVIDGILCVPKQKIIGIDCSHINEQHPLEAIFAAALTQATKGKGTRHGGNVTPFLEQPWAHYYELHGRGFLTGQAAKKLEEAASMRNGPEFVEEALGAIVYMAMAVLKEKEKLLK